jgi:hypothetical protein
MLISAALSSVAVGSAVGEGAGDGGVMVFDSFVSTAADKGAACSIGSDVTFGVGAIPAGSRCGFGRLWLWFERLQRVYMAPQWVQVTDLVAVRIATNRWIHLWMVHSMILLWLLLLRGRGVCLRRTRVVLGSLQCQQQFQDCRRLLLQIVLGSWKNGVIHTAHVHRRYWVLPLNSDRA